MQSGVCVALCLVCGLSPSVWGSTLLYDEAKLKKYAEMTQHLRDSVQRLQDEYNAKITYLNNERIAVLNDINNDKKSAVDLLAEVLDKVSGVYLTMNQIMTPMVLAYCKTPFTTDADHVYGVTALDHGMDYDSDAGTLTITIGGVYMFEYRGQTNDYKGFYSETKFTGPSTYTIQTYHDWEISPFYEMLYLKAGTTVTFSPLTAYGWGNYPTDVTPGVATQFNLRYLGQYV